MKFNANGVTVVAHDNGNGTSNIGVAVCGSKEKFRSEIGLSIAEGRAAKTPWGTFPTSTEAVFRETIAPLIVSNILNTKQFSCKALRKVKIVEEIETI